MNKKKFNTQREAENYYGHSWGYILTHYHVSYCYENGGGRRHLFISKK